MSVVEAPTKLERFLRQHGIKPAQLARESGHARQHLVRIRLGRVKRVHPATRRTIAAACSKLSGTHVAVEDLFG